MWEFRACYAPPRARTSTTTNISYNSSVTSPPGAVALLVDDLATLAAGSGDQNSVDGRTPRSLARRGEARRGRWGQGDSAASAGVVAAVDGDGDERAVGPGEGAPPAPDATRAGAGERGCGEFCRVALENSPKHEIGNINNSKLHSAATWQPFCNTRRTELPQNGASPFF